MKTNKEVKVNMGGAFPITVKKGAPVAIVKGGGDEDCFYVTDRTFIEGSDDHDWKYRYCFVPEAVVDKE